MVETGNPFTQIIDQKDSYGKKVDLARDYVKRYIKATLGERGTLIVKDGKLSSSDFGHLKKILNFYAKAQLFEIKISSQAQRVALLESNFEGYIETILDQLKMEFDAYNDAVSLVCEVAKISQAVFNITYAAESSDESAVRNEVENSFLSPFNSTSGLSRDEVIAIFKQTVPKAVLRINDKVVLEQVQSCDDLLIFFDHIVADIVFLNNNINIEEFKSLVSKYDILKESSVQGEVNQAVANIVKLSPNQ